jgi:hypothetical protein
LTCLPADFPVVEIPIHLRKCPLMQFAYELTQNDFTEAYSVHRNRSALTKWVRRFFVSVLGFCVLLVVFGFSLHPSIRAARDLLPLSGLVILWIAVLWVIPLWSMRRQFLKQPGAHGPRTLDLDSVGAHWKWSGGSADVEWRNYIRWVEGRNLLLFYTSPACFNILPKRAIPPAQLSNLRELLKQNVRRKA